MTSSSKPERRILARVKPSEFIGRNAELARIRSHASGAAENRGLLLLLSPLMGVSELLRQAYDALFNQQHDTVPICFSLPGGHTTPVAAAIEFLNAFLAQYIAFRRNEPSLAQAPATLADLAQLAPPADLEWIEKLTAAYSDQRFSDDEREFVRFCFTVARRVPAGNPKPLLLLDAVKLGGYESETFSFADEIVGALRSWPSFVLAGLRRELIATTESAGLTDLETIKLEPLPEADSRRLLADLARREGVSLSDEARDLLTQQLDGSPLLISSIVKSAREKHVALNSYFDCERLYADEILGGRLQRYFASLLEQVVPAATTRGALVRLLSESLPAGHRSASFGTWRKRLDVDALQAQSILRRLHAFEIVNWDGENVDTQQGSQAWRDFVRCRFRLDSLREPRALVVADLMADALKRAPRAVAQSYRRAASLPLRDAIEKFNFQQVPAVLFDYGAFATDYKGAPLEEIVARLDIDTRSIKLPQVFHFADGSAFDVTLRDLESENCVVAHAFDGMSYSEQNEIVWLAARVDSKLEAPEALADAWCTRLEELAKRAGFTRLQLWLIANEGFSDKAVKLLNSRGVYYSSRTQFELLAARLFTATAAPTGAANEYELVLPMGSDNELLAAGTAEQLARRLNFRPEAINQIKTAIVEACINASEHSLSPDQKIYQRFRVEDDKLVITISSRGVLPQNPGQSEISAENQRRGWGLKLIKTLMDEVEFERVDEGTCLRMVKYVR